MAKQCKACNYIRQPNDFCSDSECPNCGRIYAKVEAIFRKKEVQANIDAQTIRAEKAKQEAIKRKKAEGMICPSCGYTRNKDCSTPAEQCPKCGVIYTEYKKLNENLTKAEGIETVTHEFDEHVNNREIDMITVKEYAQLNGHSIAKVMEMIHDGTLCGVEKDDVWYVTQRKNASAKNESKKPITSKEQKFLHIIVGSFVALFIIYYFYEFHYQPKRVAEAYLRAIQLQDHENINELSSKADDDVLYNLISWNFVDTKNLSVIKEPIDFVSEDAYREELLLELEISKVTSVDALPDFQKERYKSYEAWHSDKLKSLKGLVESGFTHRDKYMSEEAGSYYMNSDKPGSWWPEKIEFLLDITASNKLGMELKKKYILLVEKRRANWKVAVFKER